MSLGVEQRPALRRRVDAVRRGADRPAALWFLQGFAWLVTLLPARLVISPLGAFGSPSSVLGLAAFGMWASGALCPGLLVRTVPPVRIAVLAMWLPGLLSYGVMHLNARSADEVNAADRWLLFMLVWSGIALLAAEGLRDASDVLRLLRVAVAGAAISSAVGLVQSRTGYDVTTLLTRIPGLKANGELLAVLERAGRRRAAGTATHPLELGTVLAMTLGPALALAQHDIDWSRPRRYAAAGLIALGVPISLSRSAVISALIVCAFWFAAASPLDRIRGFVALSMFGALLFVASPGLLGVFRSLFLGASQDPSVSMRTDDYAAVARFLRNSPWIGRGPATFLPRIRVLDNQWLLSLIEVGLIGVAGIAVYLLCIGWLGAALRRRTAEPLDKAIGQGLKGSALVVIWACSTFDFFSFQMTAAFVALLLGVAGGLYGTSTPVTPRPGS